MLECLMLLHSTRRWYESRKLTTVYWVVLTVAQMIGPYDSISSGGLDYGCALGFGGQCRSDIQLKFIYTFLQCNAQLCNWLKWTSKNLNFPWMQARHLDERGRQTMFSLVSLGLGFLFIILAWTVKYVQNWWGRILTLIGIPRLILSFWLVRAG